MITGNGNIILYIFHCEPEIVSVAREMCKGLLVSTCVVEAQLVKLTWGITYSGC